MLYCDKDTHLNYSDTDKCPFNKSIPYSAWRFYGERALELFPANQIELLAPATASTYKTAVRSGADAVYFGCGTLNARAAADNSIDIGEVVNFCHLHGVKAYLALNVMIKEGDLSAVKNIITKAEEAKIDAFIISDMALLPLIRRCSDAEVHASTQMGIHNRYGAEFAAKMGFDRIILSRETRPEDIADIVGKVDIAVEVFAHGALCVGFSGACLFSSMLTGKSGNRGRCAQLCRREYDCYINGKKTASGYLLSAKDLCMASRINELRELKVSSLKIEGRLKSEDYVSGVTAVYNKLLSGSPYTEETAESLKILFNRGNFTPGYWEGTDVVYPGLPNHMGLECGVVEKIVSKNLVLLKSDRVLYKGDCFKAVRRGKEIGGLEATGETKLLDERLYYIAYSRCEAREGDRIYLTKTAFIAEEPKRVVVEIGIRIVGGEPVHIVATCRNVKLDYSGAIAETANTEPLTTTAIKNQFSRTGDTEFEFIFVNIKTKNAFMTKKNLNELRRTVISYFEERLTADYERPPKKNCAHVCGKEKIEGDFIELTTERQFTRFVEKHIPNIVYSPELYELDACSAFFRAVKKESNRIFIRFPIFLSARVLAEAGKMLALFDGVVANDIGMLYLGEKLGKLTVAGWNLNVANTKNPLLKLSNQTVVSAELTAGELRKFKDCLVYAFGRLPLMHLNFCSKRLCGFGCPDCSKVKKLAYRDNKGEYPVVTKKLGGGCLHEFRNSAVTNLGKLADIRPRYFDFTGFSAKEIDHYLKEYFFGEGDASGFNHLHLSRGVD